MTNRLDLAWTISASIPHAGCEASPGVGLEAFGGLVYAYATDKYTIGVARAESEDGLFCHLPLSEAKDLERLLRPKNKSQQVEEVRLLVRPGELHVAFGEESAVFEAIESQMSLSMILDHIMSMTSWPRDDREIIVNPDLGARFAKGKRDGNDRMHLIPVKSQVNAGVHGSSVVTVGENFIGAVAGYGYEYAPTPSLSGWFDRGEVAA